jgi:hypothetical protein
MRFDGKGHLSNASTEHSASPGQKRPARTVLG